MAKQALVLIDIQEIYFTEGPYLLEHPIEAAQQARKLLDAFRKKNLPVIHVKHAFQGLSEIHELVKPLPGEKIIHKKYPSSFLGTELQGYLEELGVEHLVIAGMMSHMCIDTTVRACQNYGYQVTVIEDACTTKSLSFQGETIPASVVHQSFMAALNGMFADVKTLEEYFVSDN